MTILSYPTDQLLKTLHESFTLQDSSKPKKPGQPWLKQECGEKVAERAAARKRFHKYPTPSTKTLYNKASKNAKETISEAKKSFWEKFLSSLGPQTPTSRVWKCWRNTTEKISPTRPLLPTNKIPM